MGSKIGSDTWRERCAEYQKEIRYLKIKVRDLEESRNHWKQAAQSLQAKKEQKKT
jgi:hypothetical protein